MVCLYGTFAGMTAAMVGGLTASLVLFIMKKTMVHEKLEINREAKTLFSKPFKVSIPTVRAEWQTKQPEWRK